jgi:hypothetical protein
MVSTRIPRISLYARLADSKDQRSLVELEGLTNPRVMVERGERSILRKQDFFRPTASGHVKAAFSYLSKSRFGNGNMPMLYAASSEQTALAEKRYHRALFLKAHHTPPTSEKHLALNLQIEGDYHDLRGLKKSFGGVYRLNSYRTSQVLGYDLWMSGSEGIVYDSVRHPAGECVAAFSPQTIVSCSRGPLYDFHWDGQRITDIYRLERFRH